MTAPRGHFAATAPVKYRDGVSVTVAKIVRSVERDTGPGAFPGRPFTAVSLKIVNRSTAPIDLSQVVVTTVYGSPARVASPVYVDAAARDFAGKVPPGGTASAVYEFAIPVQGKSDVTMMVDFDGGHHAATFSGPTP